MLESVTSPNFFVTENVIRRLIFVTEIVIWRLIFVTDKWYIAWFLWQKNLICCLIFVAENELCRLIFVTETVICCLIVNVISRLIFVTVNVICHLSFCDWKCDMSPDFFRQKIWHVTWSLGRGWKLWNFGRGWRQSSGWEWSGSSPSQPGSSGGSSSLERLKSTHSTYLLWNSSAKKSRNWYKGGGGGCAICTNEAEVLSCWSWSAPPLV